MIRSVVTGRLRPDASDADRAALDAGLAGIVARLLPGLPPSTAGRRELPEV